MNRLKIQRSCRAKSRSAKVITMSYDRMGRRVAENGERFVYDGYLNVGQTIWDPSEPVATRPLALIGDDGTSFYFHDERKNVTIKYMVGRSMIVRYDYSPFGIAMCEMQEGQWGFSSEYCDGFCYYYNYRPYNPVDGRWFSRDPLGDFMIMDGYPSSDLPQVDDLLNEYSYAGNDMEYDFLGLACGSKMSDWIVPDKPGGFDFTGPCGNHDACYDSCGSSKEVCDSAFLRDMKNVCASVPKVVEGWCYRYNGNHGSRHRIRYRCKKHPRDRCMNDDPFR